MNTQKIEIKQILSLASQEALKREVWKWVKENPDIKLIKVNYDYTFFYDPRDIMLDDAFTVWCAAIVFER